MKRFPGLASIEGLSSPQALDFLVRVLEASPDAIVVARRSGEIVLFNPAAEQILGWSKQEVLGTTVRRLYPPGGAERIMNMIRSDGYGGPGLVQSLREVVVDSSGNLIPVEISAALVSEGQSEMATVGIFTDLRQQMRMEERLREAIEALEKTQRQAVIAEVAGAAAHELNQPLTSLLGYVDFLRRKVEEDSEMHRVVSTIYDDATRVAQVVRKIGRATRYRTRSYAGGEQIVDLDEASSVEEIDDPEQTAEIDRMAVVEKIAPHRVGGHRLQAHRALVDAVNIPLAICDERATVCLANKAFSREVAAASAVEGVGLEDLFDAASREELLRVVTKVGAGKEGFQPAVELPPFEGFPNGQDIRVDVTPLEFEGDRYAVLAIQPTQNSIARLREKFARAEELMSIGELAAGVAHELKNPLTTILNYADYLLEKYTGNFENEKDAQRLQRIIDGVDRIERFVEDLLRLAEADEMAMQSVDVHSVLRGIVQLNERVLRRHRAAIRWDLEVESPTVLGNPSGLEQVFSNLVLNSARALSEEGGTITLRTRRKTPRRLQMQVEDTGCGMAESVQSRIFEPFYTAARDGNGAGLGLALVRRLVDEHDGEISVDSTPGRGTVVTVVLPVVSES